MMGLVVCMLFSHPPKCALCLDGSDLFTQITNRYVLERTDLPGFHDCCDTDCQDPGRDISDVTSEVLGVAPYDLCR